VNKFTSKLRRLSKQDSITNREKFILAEVETWQEWKQDAFLKMLSTGQSIVFAHMAASQQAPRANTDSSFMAGQQKLKDLSDKERENICKAAIKQGYRPKPTDAYMPTMAKRKGDPDAFFNHGEGRGKVRDVCEKNRWNTISGPVSVKGYRDPEKNPRGRGPKLHPRIVERNLKRAIEKNPDLAHKDQRELRESIVDKHGRRGK
jgi:hypothetical protein